MFSPPLQVGGSASDTRRRDLLENLHLNRGGIRRSGQGKAASKRREKKVDRHIARYFVGEKNTHNSRRLRSNQFAEAVRDFADDEIVPGKHEFCGKQFEFLSDQKVVSGLRREPQSGQLCKA